MFDIGSLISAGVSSAASWFGQGSANDSNRDIAREANAQTARQAQLNRDFQERMSNTSWQRGVADMKAAGVNPMLAFSKGGASQPAGSAATATTGAPQQNRAAGVSQSLSSAVQLAMLQANVENIKAQTANTKAQTAATVAGLPGKQVQSELWTDANNFYSSAKHAGSTFGKWLGGKAYNIVHAGAPGTSLYSVRNH